MENNRINGIILETLIGQLYQQPILQSSQIVRKGITYTFLSQSNLDHIIPKDYLKHDVFQVWAGLLETPNEIITVIDDQYQRFLVKGRWDPIARQILPPI